MTAPKDVVRVAAVGDLHCTRRSAGTLAPILAEASERADVLLLCGDLTDYGTTEEAQVLAKELAVVKIPMVGVLGNHDFEAGQPEVVTAMLTDAGVTMLDGDSVEVHGVGIAGAKGFVGGFGARTLAPWGEPEIKRFVQVSLDEVLKLERALGRLRTPHRIAMLHYAPIQATVEGEPLEIYPFLGTSRLEEPLTRYPVTVVFHGHAHRGSPEGHTTNGVPVYNVAMPLLRRVYPDQVPFRLFEIRAADAAATAA